MLAYTRRLYISFVRSRKCSNIVCDTLGLERKKHATYYILQRDQEVTSEISSGVPHFICIFTDFRDGMACWTSDLVFFIVVSVFM